LNFEFSEDQKFVQQTARDYLEEHASLDACRTALESSRPLDEELWKGVAEMGWLGAAVPEIYGGAGLGHLELALIAEEVGRALAPIPFAGSVYLATEALLLAGSDEQKERYLPRLVSGDLVGSFAANEGVGEANLEAPAVVFDGSTVSGVKQPVLDGGAAGLAVVVAKEGSGSSLVLVELDASGVARTSLESFDPSRPLARFEFKSAAAERLGAAGQGASLARAILDRAAVLMAFEQVGGAHRALEITREFTLGRYAFGRPVASFQSLKHRMAEWYGAVELARSNSYYGAWALHHDNEELGVGACISRVAACEAFDLAAAEMIQMHGGVGFTWEYDCHLFYKRSRLLSLALGSASAWREQLIQRLEGREL
jgi:alkylation response protein AidB-like acyl-CoA dehydrogenase